MVLLLRQLILSSRYRSLRLRTALLMYGAILVMGSIPGARAEIGVYAPGVVLHALAYGGLAFLMFTGVEGRPRQRAVKAVLAVAAMGALDELIQSCLPYRSGDLRDWLVDLGAALIASSLLWAFLPAPQET